MCPAQPCTIAPTAWQREMVAWRAVGACRCLPCHVIHSTHARACPGGARRCAEKEGAIHIDRAAVRANGALYGGGFGFSRDLTVNLTDSVFEGNTATHGGAMEASACTWLQLDRCRLVGVGSLSVAFICTTLLDDVDWNDGLEALLVSVSLPTSRPTSRPTNPLRYMGLSPFSSCTKLTPLVVFLPLCPSTSRL